MSGSLKPTFITSKNWVTFKNWQLRLAGFSLFALLALDVGLITSAQAQQLTPTNKVETTPTRNLPTRPVLKPGSSGESVIELQATLKLLGFYQGAVDGVYDQATVKAVSRFQTAAGLKSDGITGKATWNRLFPPSPADANLATLPNGVTQPTPTGGTADSFPQPATNQPIAAPTRQPTIDQMRPTASPNQAGRAATIALPVLKLGMRGAAVSSLQDRLRVVGFYQGATDGVFGKGTETAVKKAQRSFNLKPDGVVGTATWNALLRAGK